MIASSPKIAGWFGAQKERGWLIVILGFFVGLDLVYFFAASFGYNSLLSLDGKLLRAFRDANDLAVAFGPPWLVGMGRNVTALGSAIVLAGVTFFVAGYLGLRRQWGSVLRVLAAYAGAYGWNYSLKAFFERARPEIVPHFIEVHSHSFPSGHAIASAAVYLIFASLLAQETPLRREKIYFFVGAFSWVIVIGISRVFLGVHYPTDVLAGWTLGSAWAFACWHLRAGPHLSKPPREAGALEERR